jgi:hypothetical protein
VQQQHSGWSAQAFHQLSSPCTRSSSGVSHGCVHLSSRLPLTLCCCP